MRVPIADTITLLRHVELPRSCPGCNCPVERVRLIQLECTEQQAAVHDDQDLDDWSIAEGCGDDYAPLSWRCGQCDSELVEPAREVVIAEPDHRLRHALLLLAAEYVERMLHGARGRS